MGLSHRECEVSSHGRVGRNYCRTRPSQPGDYSERLPAFRSRTHAESIAVIRDCRWLKLPFAKRLERRRQNVGRKDGNLPSAPRPRARRDFIAGRRAYGPEIVSTVAINPSCANVGPVDSQLAAEDIFCFGDSRHLCSSLAARLSTVSCSRRSRRHNWVCPILSGSEKMA